jgi:hypothetical protein
LIEQGIDSISFNPDALLKGIENMVAAEEKMTAEGDSWLAYKKMQPLFRVFDCYFDKMKKEALPHWVSFLYLCCLEEICANKS